jgi:predicted dithiol-disulfide oxidoreductase (DUF899 family)
MAEFSGKVVSAQFIDAEYTLIKVRYEDNGVLNVYQLFVNPDHPDYQDLLKEGWDTDKIIAETVTSKRAQLAAWNTEVNTAAKALVDQLLAQKSDTQSEFDVLSLAKLSNLNAEEYEKRKEAELEGQNVYNFIMDKNSDKDELFKFKMWALDLDFVKSKDKETKSALRKVQSILEGLSMLNNIK